MNGILDNKDSPLEDCITFLRVQEHHYLGLLIPHTKGVTCYEDIRTINEILYPNFEDACYSLGLLSDNREYVDGIVEASHWASTNYLCNLFAILIMSSSMSSPEHVFNKTWECLSDDILQRQRRILNMPDLRLNDHKLKNYTLVDIEQILQRNGTSLRRFERMPYPDQIISSEGHNHLIQEELNYAQLQMDVEHKVLFCKLNNEQKGVYDQILVAVWMDTGGIFFVFGFGGTGKTFLCSTLSVAVRSYGHIVLNVASSGIVSLLLPGGRTAHSRFSIPINIDESSTCHIHPASNLSALILKAKLIIWDEAPMINRYCFEALDRSLRDIIRKSDRSPFDLPFGRKIIVLGGDFRQILPMIPKGAREDIVYSTINSSHLWHFCKVLRLSRNMRLQTPVSEPTRNSEETVEFQKNISDSDSDGDF